MGSAFNVVIPARFASTRLPGKPLADICGQPMILHVVSRALDSGAAEVVVATDDERVAETVSGVGYEVALTRADHASGSDRVMEVATQRGWKEDVRVINLQGDEPLIPPSVIVQVAELLEGPGSVEVATLCEPLAGRSALFDPNVVKVVRSQQGLALYFSRAPVPYARDEFAAAKTGSAEVELLPRPDLWFRHIGIYGFTVRSLSRFVGLPQSALESTEALEQLRMLDFGMAIRVEEAVAPVPGGVDTPQDLTRVREVVGAAGD